ncbi:uncharacterized protein I206_103458 [Kwoniella pini CBS 10737]|uniref:Uncharacterized protein n=1 Tax=Kwoniella pini CBS 10737 TaxID=1296096 RepID=A0A1B9I9R3_9TREE|nr:uncharacterized protein I206_01539 [Kwoniella pini CBS 10737]OCF52253.1 hypothetical protein I206_01539 [Kwoniella pini CBS 10737]
MAALIAEDFTKLIGLSRHTFEPDIAVNVSGTLTFVEGQVRGVPKTSLEIWRPYSRCKQSWDEVEETNTDSANPIKTRPHYLSCATSDLYKKNQSQWSPQTRAHFKDFLLDVTWQRLQAFRPPKSTKGCDCVTSYHLVSVCNSKMDDRAQNCQPFKFFDAFVMKPSDRDITATIASRGNTVTVTVEWANPTYQQGQVLQEYANTFSTWTTVKESTGGPSTVHGGPFPAQLSHAQSNTNPNLTDNNWWSKFEREYNSRHQSLPAQKQLQDSANPGENDDLSWLNDLPAPEEPALLTNHDSVPPQQLAQQYPPGGSEDYPNGY